MSEPIDSFEDVAGAEAAHREVHLADYWAIVVKYRRVAVACVVVAALAGLLTTVLSRPLYRATVAIDIVHQTSNPLGIGGSNPYLEESGTEFLPSQIELLKSRDVAERVVRRLNLLANPEFNPGGAAAFAPNKNGVVRQPTAQELTRAAMRVKNNTEALVVRGTSLVQVSYVAPSGRLAADVANAVADAYIEWNIESRFRQIEQSARFLGTQIGQAKRELEEKEKALQAYARQKDIVSVDSRSGSSTQKLESFNRDYATAVADRVSKEARYQELQNTPAETLADTAASGIFAQLKGEQTRLEREYTEKLNLYKPEFPAMQQLKKQVEEGRQRLQTAIQDTATKAREAARGDYLMALRRETSLQAMTRSEMVSQGAGASEYNNLRVETDTKRALLDTLLKQQGEAEILSRLREHQVTNIRVVDRALVPQTPFKPSFSLNMTLALVLGAGLGLGLAFLLSYLDRSLRSSDQVERYLQLPTLGAIPRVGGGGKVQIWQKAQPSPPVDQGGETNTSKASVVELLPHLEPRSAIAEAYRSFRTSLLFSRAGGVKLVAITSVLPQEGKSVTAVNLAIVLAQLGRRVLLVDADLHRSRQHKMLGISNRAGLVSILAQGVEPSRVIVKTSVPGVFLVPAGPETPNPSGLLSSDDMRKFLELAATNFDHVIVDTPPVLATSDVLVFGQHTDGVVLCVSAGETPRDQVRRVRDKLLRGGVPILGVLLNGLALDSDYYGGYEYRYLNYGERAAAREDPDRKNQAGEAS
jgi:capsular exopolysaccharide synthesis family protein